MQAYAQYLPDKMMKDACGVMCGSVSVCIFCGRPAAISAPFTPPSTFRFQPLPAVATHGIDVDITFHYVTSQFSAFGRLGVARRFLAFLGNIDGRKSRRSQISPLLAGIARRS